MLAAMQIASLQLHAHLGPARPAVNAAGSLLLCHQLAGAVQVSGCEVARPGADFGDDDDALS